jgi:hypothetical protein
MVPSEQRVTTPGWRDLWRATNVPRPFDAHTLRLGCAMLCCVYGAIALLRYDAHHPEFAWIRGVVLLHGVLGAVLAPRMTWATRW